MTSRQRKTTSKTEHTGVYREHNRFRAVISIKGKTVHIGMFDTAEDAAVAYNKVSKETFGEEGKINKIKGPPCLRHYFTPPIIIGSNADNCVALFSEYDRGCWGVFCNTKSYYRIHIGPLSFVFLLPILRSPYFVNIFICLFFSMNFAQTECYLPPMPDGTHTLSWGRNEIKQHLADLGALPGFWNGVLTALLTTRIFETFTFGGNMSDLPKAGPIIE